MASVWSRRGGLRREYLDAAGTLLSMSEIEQCEHCGGDGDEPEAPDFPFPGQENCHKCDGEGVIVKAPEQ